VIVTSPTRIVIIEKNRIGSNDDQYGFSKGILFYEGLGERRAVQAQEEDAELWEGAVNYKYRVEDPRLGRFFRVDPLTMKYSFNSPFAFSENRVIDARELGGLESAFTKLNSVFKCTGIKRISLFGNSSQLRVNK
jgi:hypothetical protein